jgi:outer membrane protein
VELLHDVSQASRGNELRLGYRYDWDLGRLRLWPHAALALRDARLNNFYCGVSPAEAIPSRPSHAPGAGINAEHGLFGAYRLSERWRLLDGISVTRWPDGVRESPIVHGRA